jgi:hypothetical protein
LKLQKQENLEKARFKYYVEEIFDESCTDGVLVSFMCAQVAFRMGVPNDQYIKMQKKVSNFLRNSPDYEVISGNGAGVYRKGTTPKALKKYLEKA